jgi:hypothetical protein
MAENSHLQVPPFYPLLMLRTALLFFCLLGFMSSEIQTAHAATAPLHRRKPMAGNYRPVYKTYRGHSNQKTGFFGLFKHTSVAQRNANYRSQRTRRRGTL